LRDDGVEGVGTHAVVWESALRFFERVGYAFFVGGHVAVQAHQLQEVPLEHSHLQYHLTEGAWQSRETLETEADRLFRCGEETVDLGGIGESLLILRALVQEVMDAYRERGE
jgi:hypothetical protein